MKDCRQKQEFQKYLIQRRQELTRERFVGPQRQANCVEADVSRILDEAERRLRPFELAPEEPGPRDLSDDCAEDQLLLEQHLRALTQESQHFADQLLAYELSRGARG